MKYVYRYFGGLAPVTDVQDFFCIEGGGPNVMIEEVSAILPGEIVILPPEGDGWADGEVKTLDLPSVRRVLAEVNLVSEEDVEIIDGMNIVEAGA